MPKPVAKAPVKKAIAQPQSAEERPIVYPIRLAEIHDGQSEEFGPITIEKAKHWLGWEAEPDYIKRMMADDPELKEENVAFSDEVVTLKDEEGNKVVCWHNNRNRPFDDGHARKLAQDILQRNWAGPITMPGETINGESIIIGRTGQIESGQHRLIGLVLAWQMWKGDRQGKHWQERWATEPVIESLVFFGASEAPKVLRTLDNVKPRALSDVIFTSEYSADLASVEKKEFSRMFARAIDLLWKRSGSGSKEVNNFSHYQTHSESLAFVERHKKLMQCLRKLFECNKDRAISNLKLSPGQCSALLYLMGSSSSDGNTYRNMDVPGEKKLDWENWDKAVEFWTLLSKAHPKMEPVREALAGLVDEEGGGRLIEKHAILAKAWTEFVQGHKVEASDLELHYLTDEHGNQVLNPDDYSDFGGIDIGDKRPEPKDDPEEIQKRKDEIRKAASDRLLKMHADKKAAKEAAEKAGTPVKETDARPDLMPAENGKGPRKPPALVLQKGPSRKEVEAAQTAKAKKHDAEDAKAKKQPLKPGNAKK